MPPAELQRTATVHLFQLRQVGLGCDHHARRLAVHEVLLREGQTLKPDSKRAGISVSTTTTAALP